MRRSLFACAMWSVPCQIPTISVGEAGSAVAGAAVCVRGALVCAGAAGAAACAFTQTPLATSRNAIAPVALHVDPRHAIRSKRSLLPIQFHLIVEDSIFCAHRNHAKD